MLQVENLSPFAVNAAVFANPAGIETLYVICKASFWLQSGKLNLIEEQLPPQAADEYWGEPVTSSLKIPSDYLPEKPNTDIIIHGSAHAPNGEQVRRATVSASIGSLQQSIAIFGNREWQSGAISEPELFQQMPIVYENAFGGECEHEGGRTRDERNPVGKGYFVGKSAPDGTPLPNLELPHGLISQPADRPAPIAFAPLAPGWQPRAALAGTYDQAWAENRAPFLPLDYDPAFANAAHPGLIYPGYLEGGELISVTGMNPQGSFQCMVPAVKLLCQIEYGRTEQVQGFNLETLIIEPEPAKLYLVWKSAFYCSRAAEKVNAITVKMTK